MVLFLISSDGTGLSAKEGAKNELPAMEAYCSVCRSSELRLFFPAFYEKEKLQIEIMYMFTALDSSTLRPHSGL